MPIYLDVSSAVHGKGGIGRYTSSLACALVAARPDDFALFYNRSGDSRPPPGLESLPRRTVRAGYKPWRMAVWLGHLAGLSFDRLLPGARLFHATEHLLPPLRAVPTVLTVHDMIFKLFPEHQKRLNYWYLNTAMPLYCRRAGALITVSHASKHDIVAAYNLDPARVHVVYEAANPEFVPPDPAAADGVRRRYGLPSRYLVHVGVIEPRKNLTRLVEALQLLHDQGQPIPLVVVGGKGWLYEGFFRRLEQLDVRHSVHFTGHVPAADLPLLVGAAAAAVLPSVYEGFGLPLLEAMACGTPIACSSASSLPEIGADAPLYFDPYDLDSIAGALSTLWRDPQLQSEMRLRGLARATAFSWQRAAAETLVVYRSLLQPAAGQVDTPSGL